MKKVLLTGIVIITFLILSFAIVDVALADDGVCVELVYECEGPGNGETHTPCGTTLCNACPPGSLAHQTMCPGADVNNPPQQVNQPVPNDQQVPNNLGEWIGGLVGTAMGQPAPGTAQVPSSAQRASAAGTLAMGGLAAAAGLGFLYSLIQRLRNMWSKARPNYLQPQKLRKREPGHDFCTTPEHGRGGHRKKM